MLIYLIDSLLFILLIVLIIKAYWSFTNPHFEKVSNLQYLTDMKNKGWDIYMDLDQIPMPQIKTRKSAGHDIVTPVDIRLNPGEHRIIPTGLRCKMNADEVMLILPRSSVGIKQGVMLRNTAGVIDADYYDSDNEGHIMICLHNTSDEVAIIPKGSAFAQAVITYFVKAHGVTSKAKRKGGIGSTGK